MHEMDEVMQQSNAHTHKHRERNSTANPSWVFEMFTKLEQHSFPLFSSIEIINLILQRVTLFIFHSTETIFLIIP